MPRVSVIIPFHNRVRWLVEAVNSVLDQTYQDFEIILVDDGSTEDASCVFNLDSRIKHLRQDNKGPASARNRAIDSALGDYVAFLDSDDLLLPTKLEKQIALMESRPQVLFSHTSYQRVGEQGKEIEVVNSGTFGGRLGPEMLRDCPVATSTVVIRRDALDPGLRFEESIRVGEDTILWLRLAARSELVGLDQTLTKVRMHGRNAALDPQQHLVGMIDILTYIVQKDKMITSKLSREEASTIYLDIADLYLRQRKRSKFLRSLILATSKYPLHPRICPGFIRYLAAALAPRLRRLMGRYIEHTV
jgi:glycosyltransferase involved in cell wall biosynthesis